MKYAVLVMSMWILIGTRIFTAIVDINQMVCISNLKDDISNTGLLCIYSTYAVELLCLAWVVLRYEVVDLFFPLYISHR